MSDVVDGTYKNWMMHCVLANEMGQATRSLNTYNLANYNGQSPNIGPYLLELFSEALVRLSGDRISITV